METVKRGIGRNGPHPDNLSGKPYAWLADSRNEAYAGVTPHANHQTIKNQNTTNMTHYHTTKAIMAAAILCLSTLTACEKAVFDEADRPETEQTTPEKSVINKDTAQIDYMTVAEAQEAAVGDVICVRGYIVASCTRSMKNADFKEPFEGSTAIILADEPVDLEDFQYITDELLFPVCLTDYKDIRAALNLEENPGLWNRLIFITGVKSRYMNLPGLKKVLQYQFVNQ